MLRLYLFIKVLFLVSLLLFSRSLFSRELINSGSDPLKIIVIAGQSNAINIHADAADLDITLIDTLVSFYYHCGMPPGTNLPFFSTSNNKWTKLGIQRQVPYVAHKEYFFGPEITLINGLSNSHRNIAVIKCAYGGSNLAVDWNRNAVTGNMLYKTMTDQINNACSLLDSIGLEHTFAGFFWIQGESDASIQSYAQAYYENLREFISGVRTDLNTPSLPFFISRLPSGQPYTYLALIRSAQEKASADIHNVKLIDTDNLELDTDKVHFISSGMKELGFLMAAAFINIASSNNEQNEFKPVRNFILSQNYPNPFNPSTTIGFTLYKPEYIIITVFDVLGKEVSKLVNKELQTGSYEIEFRADGFPSGIYFCRMSNGLFSDIKKMQVLR